MSLHGIQSWQDLIRRSALDMTWFWNAALEFLGVEWSQKYSQLYDDSRGMPWTQWFLGGKLNIVHNCLDRHLRDGSGSRRALIFEADDGSSRTLTYAELYNDVNRLASAMKHFGIRKGDHIAMCTPISPEAVTVMLAAMKIGGVCMQLPARISPDEIVLHLKEAGAKILFLNDGYPRAGRWLSSEEVYLAVFERVPSLQRIVVVERLGNGLGLRSKCVAWDSFTEGSEVGRISETEAVDAEHPALILYSSGTTGRAKTAVHTHGGTLAQVAKEIGFAFDCRSNDVFYWFTNIGWMMAPWEIVGALFFGAAIVLYEGTHLYPTAHRLFELIEKHGISVFGCTPSVLRELASLEENFSGHDLSTLRILGSTGSPLDAPTWEWYFKTFGGGRCPIMNVSGGTELIGCLVSPLPVMPLKPSTVGGPGLGMAVDVCDENGESVRGESGYLICRRPFPSMTRGFLGNPQLYLNTYFPRGPDLWVHGDRALVDEDGYWYLLGRIDDLIVRGGVKHDPAKIEEKLTAFPGPPRVREAVAVGAEDAIKGERMVCFVVLDSPPPADAAGLVQKLRSHVKRSYDPLAQPDEVYFVSQLPLNLAAKIPRKLIRMVYEGKDPGRTGSLANPEALEEIRRAVGQSGGR
jgi:acetyl-CoA synthetase